MNDSDHRDHSAPYRSLVLVTVIKGMIMFFLMYAMIDTVRHFHFNLNNVYMALLMVAPMGIVMIATMGQMYRDRRRNAILYGVYAALLVISFAAIRAQTLIGNAGFLRAMIPHHSSAILMCRQARLTDPEIVRLCDQITTSQREEIRQMQEILRRY